MTADLLIQGGTLIDGLPGAKPRIADVLISGDRIDAIAPGLPENDVAVLSAEGMVVCPGFIDIHTHSDLSLLNDPRALSKVHQGVTTEVTGNCGFSAFPVSEKSKRQTAELLTAITFGGEPVPDLAWRDFVEYASAIEAARPSINVAPMVGHGTLRVFEMGFDSKPASRDAIDRMQRTLEQILEQGCLGFSTGLTYAPSSHATSNELRILVGAVARRRRLYATHARAPYGRTAASIRETCDTAAQLQARTQYSHLAINEPELWGQADQLLQVFDDANSKGVDVAFDVYPYDASSTAITQLLPPWVVKGGVGNMRRRLSNASMRLKAEDAVARGWFGGIPWIWDRVRLSNAPGDDSESVGWTIAEVSKRTGKPPEAIMLDLCQRHGNAAQVILEYRLEDDVRRFLAHPLSVIGSDGNALSTDLGAVKPHPRSFGAHARVLARYVRTERLLGLAEAVTKMSFGPANRLGLADRGRLTPGAFADLVVLRPDSVQDEATFRDPIRLAKGVVHVLVNGEPVLLAGQYTGASSGRVLRGR